MKILLATTAFKLNGGGISSYNNELFDIFKGRYVIHLLTAEESELRKDIDKVYRVPLYETFRYQFYEDLIEQINLEEYNLVINSDSNIIAIVAPFLKSPILTISHSFNNIPTLRATFNHQYNSKMIALSNAGRKYMIDFFGIKEVGKVEMIYNFVKDDLLYEIENKQQNEVLNIVYPGGATLMKYPEMVLWALRLLVKTNLKFNFYWLGDTTLPLNRFSLPKTIDQLIPKDKRIIVTNKIPRDEAEKIIANANIFILPSRAEGCPISLMEALRSGCIPIVGDAKHVCREILEDGKMGKIVKQGSHVSLYVAIKDIIENHHKYQVEYIRSLEYSKNKLSPNLWKEQMLKSIDAVSQSSKVIKKLNNRNLYSSLILYKFLAFYIGFKERWLSLKCYVKFNYYYLKIKLS